MFLLNNGPNCEDIEICIQHNDHSKVLVLLVNLNFTLMAGCIKITRTPYNTIKLPF